MNQVADGSIKPSPLIIADDHPLFSRRLATSNEREPGPRGGWRGGRMVRKALELCRSLRPELVLMDVEMPQMDGLTATREV